MVRAPDSVKTALQQRLNTHQSARWPQLTDLHVRFRGDYAYIDADEDGDIWPLCRLRYTGQVDTWGFAIHLASRNGYEDSVLPSGQPAGHPKKPSTAPAASTSATPPPGTTNPSRTNTAHGAALICRWSCQGGRAKRRPGWVLGRRFCDRIRSTRWRACQ
jgi:hypothetical protein